MNQSRGGRKQFRHRLKDALLLMGSVFLIALAFVAWQGGMSFRGVGRGVRGPTAARMPLAFGRYKTLYEGPDSDSYSNSKPAPAGPLVAPKQALEGASRWSSALLRVMPPFSSWMPPEAVQKVLAPSGAQQSAQRYSFPDALPKVALLFLTRQWLPYEPVWRAFLSSVPPLGKGLHQGWQHLFSLHVHLPPNHFFNTDSIFTGTEVEERVAVEWGQWSVVEAELVLLRAALLDPRNQRFVLLSETCVPLYPAAVVWAQLIGEPRSRLDACANTADPNDAASRMDYRWSDKMEGPRLKKEHWRKSAQWFALTAEHAQLVTTENNAAKAFREHCWVDSANINAGWAPKSFCVADEHYMPTLLASLGRQNETDCTGLLTSVWWDGPYFHPREFSADDVNAGLVDDLRVAKPDNKDPKCNAPAALSSAKKLFPAVEGELPKDMGRRLKERGDAELARERWIAQLRSAPNLEEAGEVLAGGRRLQQDGRPHKGQEAEEIAGGPEFLASNPGAWVDLGAPAGVPVGSGTLEEGSSGELSEEEAARLEELLALADAVRGDGGGGSGGSGGSGVGFVGDQEEAAAAVAEALKPKLLNDTAAWSADSPNELVRALLARYSPLGSSGCPLFARKFGEPALWNIAQVAAEYLAPAEVTA